MFRSVGVYVKHKVGGMGMKVEVGERALMTMQWNLLCFYQLQLSLSLQRYWSTPETPKSRGRPTHNIVLNGTKKNQYTMQMKSRGVGSTQYAYFLSSTLSDPLSVVPSETQYFWKLLMISCYEPLSACLALFVIRLSSCMCWKPARFLAELKSLSMNREECAAYVLLVRSKWKCW